MSVPTGPGLDPAAQRAAALLVDAFDDYNARFSDITRRARRRFERCDWRLAQADAVVRIDLSDACLKETLHRLEALLDERLRSRSLWATIRHAYAARIEGLPDRELMQTFFNSLSRRFFLTSGVVLDLEFHALDIQPSGDPRCPGELVAYPPQDDDSQRWQQILSSHRFANGYADVNGCARAIARTLQQRFGAEAVVKIELLRTLFFRERRAYLIGCLRDAQRARPLVVALVSDRDGVCADAVLTEPDQISTLFGFSRSYFHADLARVGDTVAFLQTLLPHKPRDELYTVIGRAKHGKTERYRLVFRHLADNPGEVLERAEGERGMVMSVFTPRGYPLVFKLIRDRFAYPKDSVRRQVEEKYRLVFFRDRVGRLVDAQEFHRLRFPLRQFAPDVLDELLRECSETVAIDGDELVVKHCYVERRVRPLDRYVREMCAEDALSALLDYGQAIKDLARSNIFPGDLLLKNFGVSRNGRALFYDYDELCLLEQCRFRAVPPVREEDEMRPLDEWLYAGRDDVFPELFPQFLGVPAWLREALRREHGEIFDPQWWRHTQARLRAGEHLDVPPYPESARLPTPVISM